MHVSPAAEHRKARYLELSLSSAIPIYRHLQFDADSSEWISDPARFCNLWPRFEP